MESLIACYGIGVNRIMACAIETAFDKDGIIWPISIAPFEVLITSVNHDDADVRQAAVSIYEQLKQQKIDVLLDDRAARGGVKFKDADLVGIPVRITVGKRGLAEGNVEIKLRRDADKQLVPLENAATRTVQLVEQLYQEIQDNVPG